MKVAELVKENIKDIFDSCETKLVDVEYKKLHDGMHLLIYIDKLNGVTVDDCVEISNKIDPILDELNPTNDASYRLDVMSYGLDKPLIHEWQLEKYKNKKVCIKLYAKLDGKKDFEGDLLDFNDYSISLNVDDKTLNLERKDIAQILPYIEF